MWLRDTVPDNLEGARVMIYGYDSHLAKSDSVQDLAALGSSFCTHLESIRSGVRLCPAWSS